MINYINNSNNNVIQKINLTQQNNNFNQHKNQKNQLRNKIFNFNKNLIYDNYKKISIPSISNKQIFSNSNDDKIFNKNNNNNNYINKKIQINKTNYYLNNPLLNKTKNIINLTRNIIYKPKDKTNTLSKNKKMEINQINNDDNSFNISKNVNQLTNKSYILKNDDNSMLINKQSPKKKINININIRNNNKIIYNKIIDNKSSLLKGNQKTIKSPIFKNINSYINNTSYDNSNNNNFNFNILGKKSLGKINIINNMKKKNSPKINLINVQFPKAKLLNIYN